MPIELAWSAGYLSPLLLMLSATVLYVAAHYASRVAVIRRLLGGLDQPANAQQVVSGRWAGALILGPLTLLAAFLLLGRTPWDLGLLPVHPLRSLFLVVAVPIVVLPIVILATRSPGHQARYPEIRASLWNPALVRRNALSWAGYLLCYEFFFRGFLLFELVQWLGNWPGLAVMTALYTFAHLPKDPGETIGCVLMGFVFGGAALYCGQIYVPSLIHLAIAQSSDLFAVRHSTEMNFGANEQR